MSDMKDNASSADEAKKKKDDEAKKALDAKKDSKDDKADEKDGDKKDDKKLPPFMKKSEGPLVSEEELSKSLTALEALTKTGPGARKQELLAKSSSGEATDAESAELAQLLLNKPEGGLSDKVAKSMDSKGNETLEKALDVSDYLGELHKSITTSLGAVADALQKSESKREEQAMVLAKALLDIGKLEQFNARLIKSLDERVGQLAVSPARAPKSAGLVGAQAEDLGKSQDKDAQKTTLSKSQVLDTLEDMLHKSETGMAATGESYLEAITKFEQRNDIHPLLIREVLAFRKSQS